MSFACIFESWWEGGYWAESAGGVWRQRNKEPKGDSFRNRQPPTPGPRKPYLCPSTWAGSSSENEIWPWRIWKLRQMGAHVGQLDPCPGFPQSFLFGPSVGSLQESLTSCLKGDIVQTGSMPSVFPSIALWSAFHRAVQPASSIKDWSPPETYKNI